MRLLLAIDGSDQSYLAARAVSLFASVEQEDAEAAVHFLSKRPFSHAPDLEVLTVFPFPHTMWPMGLAETQPSWKPSPKPLRPSRNPWHRDCSGSDIKPALSPYVGAPEPPYSGARRRPRRTSSWSVLMVAKEISSHDGSTATWSRRS